MSILGSKRSVYFGITWWAWQELGAVELIARPQRSFLYCRAVIINLLVTAAFPVMLLLTTLSFELPLDNLMNFNISLTSVAAATKFVIYVTRLKKLAEIEILLARLDERIDTKEQRSCHAGTRRILQILKTLYKCTYTIVGIASVLNFVFRGRRTLPFPAWFPLDWSNSVRNYAIAVLHQLLAIYVQILQNFVTDLFPPLALVLIAGQCELLVLRLSPIGYDQSSQRSNEHRLVACIRDQQKIYKLHQMTMDVVSWPLLVQFIVIAIDVGAALSALLFYVNGMKEAFYFVTFIFGLTLQILPVCYFGTVVENSFGRLHSAVYTSNWVDQSMAYRRNAIIFVERSRRPPKQIAGHLIPIALTTFLANCKAAYSFCTLIADTGKGALKENSN